MAPGLGFVSFGVSNLKSLFGCYVVIAGNVQRERFIFTPEENVHGVDAFKRLGSALPKGARVTIEKTVKTAVTHRPTPRRLATWGAVQPSHAALCGCA